MNNFEFKRSTNKHHYFYGIDLIQPNNEIIKQYSRKFREEFLQKPKNNNLPQTEKILDDIFGDKFEADNVNEVYKRCVLLNTIYSINVKYLNDLVLTIVANKDLISKCIINKDCSIVDSIKKIKIRKRNNVEAEISYYSFFTKYLRRYAPDSFPIYDDIAKNFIMNYFSNLKDVKSEEKKFIINKNMSSYVMFKKAVDCFISRNLYIKELVQNGETLYTVFDHFVWMFGKEAKERIEKSKEFLKLEKTTKRNKNENERLQQLKTEIIDTQHIEKYLSKYIKK